MTESEFKEISVPELSGESHSRTCGGIELCWDQGKGIRFPEVAQLVDFLKKVA